MKLVIVKGETGLNQIESEWNELFNNLTTPTYSQSIIWHKAYLKYLAPDVDKCFYFCIYKHDTLIAIFPLEQVQRKFYIASITILSFPSNNHFGINSVITDQKENTQNIFQFLYQSLKMQKNIAWDVIYLNKAIENSQASLCKIDNQKLCLQKTSTVCDILPIQTYKRTYSKFSRRLKRNLKKGKEIISNSYKIEYKSTRNEDELDAYFTKFLDIEASGWKGINGEGTAIKLHKNLSGFYLDILHGFAKTGNMEINLLSVNGKYIAAQYAIILEPTVFLIKIGYDEGNRNLSPGNLLLEHELQEYAKEEKLKILNLISDAGWHKEWKPTRLPSYKIYNCRNIFIATGLKAVLRIKDFNEELMAKNGFETAKMRIVQPEL